MIIIMMAPLTRYAYLLWKKKKSCLKRKKNKKQSEDEGKLRVARKEDYRSKVFPEVEQSIKKKTIMTLMKMIAMVVILMMMKTMTMEQGSLYVNFPALVIH